MQQKDAYALPKAVRTRLCARVPCLVRAKARAKARARVDGRAHHDLELAPSVGRAVHAARVAVVVAAEHRAHAVARQQLQHLSTSKTSKSKRRALVTSAGEYVGCGCWC